jgi:hypothetical protein
MDAFLHLIKDGINFLGNPKYSFTLFSVAFLWALFQPRIWTKQGTIIAMTSIFVLLVIALQDANFATTLLKPDNAPIFLMIFVFGFCLWIAMMQAHNNDRRMAQKLPPEEKETSDQKTWVWPDLVYIEFLCMILCTVFLVVWSLTVRAPLEEPANPGNTPNPSKAPWYFLGLQELLVYFDPWFAGVVMPSIIVLGLMAIPYIDTNPKGNGYYCFKDRRLSIVTFMVGFMLFWNFLIVIGTVLRGPGWNFFGPFEAWNPHKVVALTNVNLSEYVWVKWFYPLGKTLHLNWLSGGVPETDNTFALTNIIRVFKKEFVGILFLIFWFLYLPGRLAKGPTGKFSERIGIGSFKISNLLSGTRNLYEKLGFGRYAVAIFLFLTMATVPMKMYLRWLINLKYIVDTPWIKF